MTHNYSYYDEYVAPINILQLGADPGAQERDQSTYGVRLWEAYPKTIGAIPLNQAPATEIIKIPVSFSFRWWDTLDVNRQAPSLKEKIFSTVMNTVERNIERNTPSVISKLGN